MRKTIPVTLSSICFLTLIAPQSWAASQSSESEIGVIRIRPNESVAPTGPDTVHEAGAVKLSGFLDAQVNYNSTDSMSRGFLINDGAFYLTTDKPGIDFRIDIPFRMYTAGSNNFEIGLAKAQAFIGQKYSNGFRWKIGQFDSTYGFELNDTTDITFTRQGSMFSFVNPVSHAGIMLGWDFDSENGVNLYMTNPNDRGIASNRNLQYGLQFVKASSTVRFAPGVLVSNDPISGKLNYYLDFIAGVTLGHLAMDFEANYKIQNDQASPSATVGNQGLSALANLVYWLSDSTTFGLRAESVTNQAYTDPKSYAGLPLASQYLIFVGPQHWINKNIRLKMDYAYQSDQTQGSASRTPSHGIQIASVFRF